MGRRMNKEGIATLQHASMGLLCDPRKREEILNDLRVEWVRLVLELELVNIVRRRFPGHSEGAYGHLERWIDELGFIGSDVRFFAQRLWRVIVSWFWAGVFISSHRSDGPLDLKQFRNRFLFLFLFRFVARSLDNLADSLRHPQFKAAAYVVAPTARDPSQDNQMARAIDNLTMPDRRSFLVCYGDGIQT